MQPADPIASPVLAHEPLVPPPAPEQPERRVGLANRRVAFTTVSVERRVGAANRRVAGVVAPADTPTHVVVTALGTDEPAAKNLIDESLSFLAPAIAGIAQRLDQVLAGAAAEIVPLEAELLPAAAAFIEARTNPQIGGVVKSLIGIATPYVNPLEQMVNAHVLAGIHILRADLAGFKLFQGA